MCPVKYNKEVTLLHCLEVLEKVQVGKDQEKAQSAKDSHSKVYSRGLH